MYTLCAGRASGSNEMGHKGRSMKGFADVMRDIVMDRDRRWGSASVSFDPWKVSCFSGFVEFWGVVARLC